MGPSRCVLLGVGVQFICRTAAGISLCMASEFANQGPSEISARFISYSPKSPVRRANFWVKRTTSGLILI